MQSSLFGEISDEALDLPGAKLRIVRSWLDSKSAAIAFESIQQQTRWQNPKIKIAGQWLAIPRLQAWYGDDGHVFTYSGASFTSAPMFDELIALKIRLEREFAEKFNSVLVNCYRDASDSVGWHADDEPEFGEAPVIASLSLGESRRFCLKPRLTVKDDPQKKAMERRPKPVELSLNSGDLVLMSGATQRNWIHCVPKERVACGPRINLTFRYVIS